MKMPISHKNSFLNQIYVQSVSQTKQICHHHTYIPKHIEMSDKIWKNIYITELSLKQKRKISRHPKCFTDDLEEN